MAQALQQLGIDSAGQQDEQDRRWQNMSYEIEKLKEVGRDPNTGTGFQKILIKHGLQPQKPLPPHIGSQNMQFDVFMEKCGRYGWSLLSTYEAQAQPDAPRRCDGCKVRGATMRCANCGEFYCSDACQRKGWRDHRDICGMAGRTKPRSMPQLMSSEDYQNRILKPSGAGTMQNVVAPRRSSSSQGKNAKKNKKKREAAKAAKAEATESAAAREDVD